MSTAWRGIFSYSCILTLKSDFYPPRAGFSWLQSITVIINHLLMFPRFREYDVIPRYRVRRASHREMMIVEVWLEMEVPLDSNHFNPPASGRR